MFYLTQSMETVGYKVRVWHRPAFKVVGYTHLISADAPATSIPNLWKSLKNDGRLQAMSRSSPVRPWILGLSSWDPACDENGYRYTICIEQTSRIDLTDLPCNYIKEIGASDWMHFEINGDAYPQPFWSDNPYKMVEQLGYSFNRGASGDYSIGLHFDAYPPDYDVVRNPRMEFWITVKEPALKVKLNFKSMATVSK